MQMPEASVSTFKVMGGSRDDVCGYERYLSVLMPRRRYLKGASVLTALGKLDGK